MKLVNALCGLGLICFTLVLGIAAISCRSSEDINNERPNILFIMSDDHSSQAWGLYGGHLDSVAPTPHIQRLAREGCLLLNCFCTNSICVPSRATILTGQYSHRNHVYSLSDSLDPEADNVAKILKNAGYQTAIIGKWHLKTQPTGFDHFTVLPGQGRYHDPILKTRDDWEQGREYTGFSTDVITDLCLEWLEQRQSQQPFFLMCHFKATHEPFDYADRFQELFQDQNIPEPPSLYEFGSEPSGRSFSGQVLEILGDRFVEGTGTRYPGESFDLEGLNPEAARSRIYQKFIKDYLRGVAGIDENIGRLLTYLDETGLYQNTVVIYTSDQGYFLGEHGFFDKRIMYEEALRMPFVIRYPQKIPAGVRNRDMVLNCDFAPLFLDFAGTPTPEWMQGTSFRPNLSGPAPENWRRSLYYRYWLHQAQRPAHFGIRSDRYKLIYFYGEPLDITGAYPVATPAAWEFYDLALDPEEMRNAYFDPEYREIILELKLQLQSLREELGDTDDNRPWIRESPTNR